MSPSGHVQPKTNWTGSVTDKATEVPIMGDNDTDPVQYVQTGYKLTLRLHHWDNRHKRR
jgi:hypothetical protein